MVLCTGVKTGKCKNTECIHAHEHTPDRDVAYEGVTRGMTDEDVERRKTTHEYCTRWGFCSYYPVSRMSRPVHIKRRIEVRCE
jgi:hypothetical protein